MAPQYKLKYFKSRGRGEPIRLVLAYLKVPYEDIRYDLKGDWATVKASTPWGQLPVLEVDGVQLAQTNAICRYLAKKHGATGETDLEQAKCDEYLDAQTDLLQELGKWFFETDAGKKVEVRKNLLGEVIPRYFGKFDAIIQKNGNGVLVGKKITYVDICLADMVSNSGGYFPDLDMNKFPALKKHSEMVFSQPSIKDWIERRPKTAF